jgi:ribosomal protein S15P/S13E
MISLENASRAENFAAVKTETIEKFQRHEADVGSSEVQGMLNFGYVASQCLTSFISVGVLTARILHVAQHLRVSFIELHAISVLILTFVL